MALTKQPVQINFAQGLSTKVDPNQIQLGQFAALQNSVFDTIGRLSKRNGYKNASSLPSGAAQTNIMTLNDNLVTTGSSLYALSQDTQTWLNQGPVTPVSLDTQPLLRSSTSQTNQDSATDHNGLVCLAYIDSAASQAYYQVSDSSTGQQVVQRTALPATAVSPRVFVLGNYFIITFLATVAGSAHLQYIAISTTTLATSPAPVNFASTVNTLTAGYDGVVVEGNLYLAWAASGSSTQLAYLTAGLAISASATISGKTATRMAVIANQDNQTIWVVGWDGTIIWAQIFSATLATLSAATTLLTPSLTIQNLTGFASTTANSLVLFYEVYNLYYGGGPQTDYIASLNASAPVVPTDPIVLGTTNSSLLRSVGLASKAFDSALGPSVMVAYGETNQPTYFLINAVGQIFMRLAYANGGGYITGQVLPSVSLIGDTFQVSYLYKDFLTTVNKNTDGNYNGPVNAFYAQTGVNLATFTVNLSSQESSEIAGALHLTGGQLWEYDSIRPVEHGFQVWPENIAVSTSGSGGNITAQQYYYQFTYEWTDNQGNIHRSAPSIPIGIVTSGATSTNTLKVPTLRLTYKLAPNPVRIVGYRWSAAQQVYYQFTAIPASVANNTTVDFVTITDTSADSAILGQPILYTTGGVVENIAAPASKDSALFDNRLWLIDAEDQNLLWFSKQVIEATPVEMSDLLTVYVAPSTGTQGSTGPSTALAPMDDKLIIFKKNAAYYINGTGPDNTRANSQYSQPIFITSSVGCDNPRSIVLMQNGLMFQTAGKGIWLLGRDLSTNYIGAPVEKYNSATVLSAHAIPGTNQVRFELDNGITLMYDYFVGQWGTFTNIKAISSTLWQNKHTYLNSVGQIFQEAPGTYLDGSLPVLMSFTTSWVSLAGLQGFERFYQMLLLGNYYSPFKLAIQMAYDFNPTIVQNTIVTPDNFGGVWGSQSAWGGGGPWGGTGLPFEARFFPTTQKCESFQVTVAESYDPSFGPIGYQGLSLSGLNLSVGIKKGSRNSRASRNFGG